MSKDLEANVNELITVRLKDFRKQQSDFFKSLNQYPQIEFYGCGCFGIPKPIVKTLRKQGYFLEKVDLEEAQNDKEYCEAYIQHYLHQFNLKE